MKLQQESSYSGDSLWYKHTHTKTLSNTKTREGWNFLEKMLRDVFPSFIVLRRTICNLSHQVSKCCFIIYVVTQVISWQSLYCSLWVAKKWKSIAIPSKSTPLSLGDLTASSGTLLTICREHVPTYVTENSSRKLFWNS